jgi:ABC-type uncharacterized transport system permease subunit
MGIEFIHRVIKTSLILAFLIFLFVSFYYRFDYASGIFVGCGWGCMNLFFLTNLITETTNLEGINKKRVLLLVLLKFPLLYVTGYFLLRINYFPVTSLLVGFTLIFAVVLLKAVGKMVISLPRKKDEKFQAGLDLYETGKNSKSNSKKTSPG